MHAVDVQQRTGLVHPRGDTGHVGPGAEQVRRAGHRDQPGPVGERYLVAARWSRCRRWPSEHSPRRTPRPAPRAARSRRGRAGSRPPRRPVPSPSPASARRRRSAGSCCGRTPRHPGPRRAGRRSPAGQSARCRRRAVRRPSAGHGWRPPRSARRRPHRPPPAASAYRPDRRSAPRPRPVPGTARVRRRHRSRLACCLHRVAVNGSDPRIRDVARSPTTRFRARSGPS